MMNYRYLQKLFMFCACFSSSTLIAQSTLPQGVGLIQYGYRGYTEQVTAYDGGGEKVPLANKLTKPLDGPSLLAGKGGSDLQKLAEELNKYDGQTGDQGLLESLDLGRIEGDVKATIEAQIFGFGYGLTNNLTFYAGVPIVKAEVHAGIAYIGRNNALEIKNSLGDLAFDELKAGLDKASQISAEGVLNNIAEAEYEPLGTWEHQGIGDVRLGTMSSFQSRLNRRANYTLGLTTVAELPTGYYDNPDILTDVSFGRGYYSLGFQLDHVLTLYRYFQLGVDMAFRENLQTQVDKRVPLEDESLVAKERTAQVTLSPGDDMGYGSSIGYAGDLISARWRAGVKKHFSDSYSGSLVGNYDKLAEDSSSYQAFQEIRLGLSTVKAYQNGFPVPFLLEASAHLPFEGKNTTDEQYYEVSISSFFSTPFAADEKPSKKRKRMAKKRGKKGKRSQAFANYP